MKQNCKFYQSGYLWEAYQIFFKKNFLIKTMHTLTVFEILLFEDELVLSTDQQSVGSESLKVSVKNVKNTRIWLKLVKNWLNYKLGMM